MVLYTPGYFLSFVNEDHSVRIQRFVETVDKLIGCHELNTREPGYLMIEPLEGKRRITIKWRHPNR